ncbi:polysaccharide lyase 6 family protein [Altererythrobacter sp. ZODW24]|uniref:polysaccharide lyase 6 family protein n=1 Tax=Altererythrobacter sp. ZODW24 TaxID=2185142 RepID=UPI0013B3E89F|nr:polysaccharide lyase 6 family protein [Altererythrobacter sp. ZODW24]
MLTRLGLTIAACLCIPAPALAENFYVKTQAEYFAAAKDVQAGDVIILAAGNWQDFEIVLTGKGTAKKPITLISEAPGKTVITGKSNLRIGGEYILVTGLTFIKGSSPTGEVISFRRSKTDQARNSRVTEVVIDGFNKPDRYETDYWVGMYGSNNRFDHNYLAGKSNKGVTMAVRLDSEESRENGHRIDHNYFGARPILGSNGGETLRVGTSKYSMYLSNTIIEDNYFEKCDGEVEIISIKAGGNTVRRNVFDASRGALTLRHGDDNLIERNVFLGRGKDHTGGIRVINQNQTVRGNYMEGLRGTGFASALTVMNGVPNSPVNRYVQVKDAHISNNSILDSKRVTFGAGADEERSAFPIDSSFTDNILSGAGAGTFVEVDDDTSGIAYSGNVLAGGNVHSALAKQLRFAKVEMVRAENGLLYPADPALAAIGAPRDLAPIARDATGPAWYPKPKSGDLFAGGATVQVAPGDDTLSEALMKASDGDTLQLATGTYNVSKTLQLTRAVSIVGIEGQQAPASVVKFARPSLFEIGEGGSIRLVSLSISGEDAPDNVGNNVIRTKAGPVLRNFSIEMQDVHVTDLTVNKSFDVIAIGKSALADNISIADSSFERISGTVVNAAAETDDYGQYNAEYVTIEDSSFADVEGMIANIYRGGRDESTFGPHFTMNDTAIANVGRGKNNPAGVSLLLHGVQDAKVSENSVAGSAPIKVVHTVGTPQTAITDNAFADTPAPVIEEMNYDGPQRALIAGNVSQ